MAVYQKILWIVAAALLVGLRFWLRRGDALQGWAQWDWKRWQIVAESWAVCAGWPLVTFGRWSASRRRGSGWPSPSSTPNSHFRAKIARLTSQRDAAMAEAEARVLERERKPERREAAALAGGRGRKPLWKGEAASGRRAGPARRRTSSEPSHFVPPQRHLRGGAHQAPCRGQEAPQRRNISTSAPNRRSRSLSYKPTGAATSRHSEKQKPDCPNGRIQFSTAQIERCSQRPSSVGDQG